MGMKKSIALLGLSTIIMESLSSENSYAISKNPESEKDKRKRQYQQELNDEWMIAEYRLIQQKQSKLPSNARKKIVMICEKRFSQETLNP